MTRRVPSDVLSKRTVSSIVWESEKREAEARRKARARKNHWTTATEEAHARMEGELVALDVDKVRKRVKALGFTGTHEGMCFLRALEGWKLCEQGKQAEGIAVWDALTEEHPTFAMGHYLRGTQALIAKSGDALVHLDLAVALDPGNGAFYWRRGRCHQQHEDWEKALADFRRAIALEPDSPDWLFKTACFLYSLRRYKEALECCSKAIQRAPRYADFYYVRGKTYVHLHRHAAAIPDFEHALSLDPDYRQARAKLAFCHWKTGEPERAQKEVKTLLDADPTNKEAREVEKKVEFSFFMLGTVIEPLNQQLQADPDNVTLLVQRANMWGVINARHRMREDLCRAIELAPDDMSVAEEHLRVYVSRKDPEGSLTVLTPFIERFPASEMALEKRSEMYEALGKHDLALADLRRRVELHPDDPEGYCGLAYHYRDIGRPEEGLPFVEHALTLAKSNAEQRGNALGVRAALRRAANPEDPRIKEDEAAEETARREQYGNDAYEAAQREFGSHENPEDEEQS